MHRKILFISLALALLLYGMHQAALEYSLYWVLWWYDIPMHFLGGTVLGGMGVWLFAFVQARAHPFPDKSVWMLVASFVLLGSVAWEIYEYGFDLTYNPLIQYPFDTVKDLVMDLLGGFSVIWFYQKGKFGFITPSYDQQ